MAKEYRINESGGLTFKGKTYPEHSTHTLTNWGQADIEAALRSGIISEVIEKTTIKKVTDTKPPDKEKEEDLDE